MTETDQSDIDAILKYWFADIGEGFDWRQQSKLWYGFNPEVDNTIKQHFGSLVTEAVNGGFSAWLASAEGYMALIILLDQMPRNIYRGSAQAFAGDGRATQLVRSALVDGVDIQLNAVQRSFFYMPLEHSELLADQLHCVALFEQLLTEVPEAGKAAIQSSLNFAIHHRDIFKRFGRFPHRNSLLQRQSTAAEQQYLDEGGARFGQ